MTKKIITCTNGNNRNGINGSRITIKDTAGNLIDRFTVTKHNGVKYCKDYPKGIYGKRFFEALNS